MTDLRTAAQQALEALEGGADSWQLVGPAIDALRTALVEDAMQKFTDVNQELEAALGCDHCNQPLYAAVKCRVCGRVTSAEPVQEPVAWSFEARHIDTAFGPAVSIRHPGREHKYMRNVKPLYTASPQRKPLTETSAERTLKRLGYTDCGGEFWKPPLGAPAEPVQEPVAGRAFLERILAAMEGVIDVADRKTDEFDALRSCVIDLTLMLHTAPPQRPAEPVQEPQCNPHPKAPHGFLRNASHTEDRYVCECEYWDPYEAGYQAGMEAALKEQA